METFIYTFSINAENGLLKTNNPIFSPLFKTTFNGVSFSWKMQFKCKTDKNKARPSLYLRPENGDQRSIDTKFQFVLIPNEKMDIDFQNAKFIFNGHIGFGWEEYSRFSFDEQIPKEVKIYSDNCFKIICKIYIPHKCFELYLPKPVPNEGPVSDTECLFAAAENFLLPKSMSDKLFDQAIGNQPPDGLCDVVFQSSDGKSFYCHSFVLAFSSEVLKTMFSRFDMEVNPENAKQSIVEIPDIDGDTFTEVLRFIYKKEFSPNVDNLLSSCLYAAEKYDLADLKAKCIASLKFNLTSDNVLDYLDLADKFSSQSLKMACFEILRLFDHMIDKQVLEIFLVEHGSVSVDFMKHLYECYNANLVL